MKRYFNTSGPNIAEQHYTLLRKSLIENGLDLVRKARYFTIWAPRQAGKSTYFQMLSVELKKEGYKVCHLNFENFQIIEEEELCLFLSERMSLQWAETIEAINFTQLYRRLSQISEDKKVLIIDEIEGLNPALMGRFLHSIRNCYHSRMEHALKSVIFVGISNITSVIEKNASPFNISDSFALPYFTKEEVFELFGQHESETGQLFSVEVKEKIYEITAGQPGLVNGFGLKLTENQPDKAVLDYGDYLVVEDWYLHRAIDKNVSNILNKAKEKRYLMEELLFKETKKPFKIDNEDIQFLTVNGLLRGDENGNIEFAVPLYKKRLQEYFYPHMNGEAEKIQENINLSQYFTDNGTNLNIDKIIRDYQKYAKMRGFRYFIERDAQGNPKTLKEAALIYSFETYIQAFLQVIEGKSYLEAHVALGKSDLIVNIAGNEFVIEAKVFKDITQYKKGKIQLAYYLNSKNISLGIYLVFIDKKIKQPDVFEQKEVIDGANVVTYIVPFDVKKDFGDDLRQKEKR